MHHFVGGEQALQMSWNILLQYVSSWFLPWSSDLIVHVKCWPWVKTCACLVACITEYAQLILMALRWALDSIATQLFCLDTSVSGLLVNSKAHYGCLQENQPANTCLGHKRQKKHDIHMGFKPPGSSHISKTTDEQVKAVGFHSNAHKLWIFGHVASVVCKTMHGSLALPNASMTPVWHV